MLKTEQQKDRPDQIEKLCSEEQKSQRRSRRNPLRSQCYAEVSDEHGNKLSRWVCNESEIEPAFISVKAVTNGRHERTLSTLVIFPRVLARVEIRPSVHDREGLDRQTEE
jgi:hypothetical protein